MNVRRSEMTVIGIDPGGTTGWSVGVGSVREAYGESESDEFLRLLFEMDRVERVVIERFDMQRFDNDALATIKLIGAIEWICRLRGMPYVEVSRSDKKKFIDYTRSISVGKPHAADAEALRLYDLEYGKW